MRNPKSSAFAGSRNAASVETSPKPRPAYFLEILRGRTGFPRRPIDSPEFLIGAAVECQLRLGGEQTPPRHSRISMRDGIARIEVLAENPPLRINGAVAKEATLKDGDRISIGTFEFALHDETPAAEMALPSEDLLDEAELEAFDPEDLKELSASELVDLIEQEQAMVDEFESRRRQGAMALLNAVRERTQQLPEAAGATYDVLLPISVPEAAIDGAGEETLSEGLQQLLVQLTELSQALEKRSERLSRREAGYAEAVSLLMDAQEKLALQLEFLAGRLSGGRDLKTDTAPVRAIA